jgi:tetratricopeptide (TPR) repeat protein
MTQEREASGISDPWPAPARLGPYALGEVLGQGGMGRVYAAQDLVLDREVALKLLWRTDPGLQERFLQEARLQARLDHPSICKIYQVEASGSNPYIAMQRVRGKGLLEVALNLEPEAVLDLMGTCASAVHAAHEAGMIHRDLKPCNILLEPDSQGGWHPMVVDFGLAKDLDGPNLTVGSRVLGTPDYMAPEQAMGRGASVASDVYALGATFYAFLAGRPPFQADSPAELMLKQSREAPPSLRSLNPDVPAGLEAILAKCMAKAPAKRYVSALALAEDLQRLKAGRPLLAQGPQRLRQACAALAALAVLALAPLAWKATHPAQPPMTGLQGTREHPTRVVLVNPAPGPALAWMSLGLQGAARHVLANQPAILPILAEPGPLARAGGLGPASLQLLARHYRADLVLLTRIVPKGPLLQVASATLRPGEGKVRPLLTRTFAPERYLEAESELRLALPSLLGVPNPGGRWQAAGHLPARRAELEARVLLDAPDASSHRQQTLAALHLALAEEPAFAPAHVTLARFLNGLAGEEGRLGHPRASDQHLQEAVLEAGRAIQFAPSDPGGYQELSSALRQSGDLEGAERAALQALKVSPLDPASHRLLAIIENLRPGAEAYQVALDHMRIAQTLSPHDAELHHRLAQFHLDAGQFRKAAAAEERALALAPDLDVARLVRTNALLWDGRLVEARAALAEALRHAPGYALLIRNQAYLDYLEGNRATFGANLARAQGLWPEGGTTRAFLDGLADAFEGRWPQAAARYGAALRTYRETRKDLRFTAFVTTSVDLYLMGRVLAQGPRRREAIPFILAAETLSRKRLRMAQRDPAFRGLWPKPAPWPED